MNFQTMQHQKLNYRIPYPSLLHIEENQIYKGVERPAVELDEEKGDINKDPKAEKPIDKYVDLNIYENEYI